MREDVRPAGDAPVASGEEGTGTSEAAQPPRDHSAWTWGWNFAPSLKVWTTDTSPGRKPFSSTAATMKSLTVS